MTGHPHSREKKSSSGDVKSINFRRKFSRLLGDVLTRNYSFYIFRSESCENKISQLYSIQPDLRLFKVYGIEQHQSIHTDIRHPRTVVFKNLKQLLLTTKALWKL